MASPARLTHGYRSSAPGPSRQLVIGHNVVRNEKISTFNKGSVQLIFADQSTLTLAENSEIVIDEFVYDPPKQAGTMTATVTTGVLRYVGGKISKKNDVSFLTPSGVVTVRGGIALIKVSPKPGPHRQPPVWPGKTLRLRGATPGIGAFAAATVPVPGDDRRCNEPPTGA